jgi:DNA-binding FadR family transcriptional regulator
MIAESPSSNSGRGRTAHEQAAAKLRQFILSGRAKEEGLLAPEEKLAKQLGVSRLTLRAAVAILVEQGLLTVAAGLGTHVRSWKRDGSFELFNTRLRMAQGTDEAEPLMKQALWLRRTMYCGAVELLCTGKPKLDYAKAGAFMLGGLFLGHAGPAAKQLDEEEKVLCNLIEATDNTPAIMLAHAVRRSFAGIGHWSAARPTLNNATKDFVELVELLEDRKQPAAEKAMLAICRLREKAYVELASADRAD